MKYILIVLFALVIAACGPDLALAPPPPDQDYINTIIHEAFNPLGQGDKAIRVASCESGLNPGAVGGIYQGLFQLGPHIIAIHAYGGNRLDAWQNVQAARDLFVTRGNWSAWPVCGRR